MIERIVRPTRIAEDQLVKINKGGRPSVVKFREEDGGGYMATLEFGHQMHCLVSYSHRQPYVEC